MEHLLKFIEIIAWPVTVLTLVVKFHPEIRGLLSRVIVVKYKDWTATFEKTTAKIEGDVPQLKDARPSSGQQRLERLAEISPRLAILESWIELEQVVSLLAKIHKLDALSTSRVIRALQQKGILSLEIAESFYGLRKLGIEAARLPDFAVEEEQAERYIALASGMGLLLTPVSEITEPRSETSARL